MRKMMAIMEELPGTPPKPPRQPWPFGLHIFQEEWPEVKKARKSFILCAILCACIGAVAAYWLVDKLYAAESRAKDATIQSLQQQLQAKQSELQPTDTKPLSSEQPTTNADDSVAIGPGAKAYSGSVAIGKNARAGVPPIDNLPPVRADATAGDSIVNSKDSAIIRGGVFSGNTIIASHGATINQIVTNSLPKPFIQSSKLASQSVILNGAFVTVYEIEVGHPTHPMRLTISNTPPIVAPMVIQEIAGGNVVDRDGVLGWGRYSVKIVTSEAIDNTNVSFSVESAPAQ